jgi:hypothetical protein
MAGLASFIGSLFSTFFAWIAAAIQTCASWVLAFFLFIIHEVIYLVLLAVQVTILALVDIANAAIALLPACNIPTIDLSSFTATLATSSHSVASALCWVLPIAFLSQAFLCAVNAILAYIAISWALRWLKVIK